MLVGRVLVGALTGGVLRGVVVTMAVLFCLFVRYLRFLACVCVYLMAGCSSFE